MQGHVLVTGAMGFIGAWVVRELVAEGATVTAFDLGTDAHRLRLVMPESDLARVRFLQGDITDPTQVAAAAQGMTHIIHLAALQVPACKANPVLGAQVNVVGTVNLFEAAQQAGIRHIAYASSVAVFGYSEDYSETLLGDDARLNPRTLYGVYKQANEATARVYWQDAGISSIGLRPYTVYGPGRDQGLTSAPTKAMLAAAAGQSYHIPFGQRSAYQYAADTARLFIAAARAGSQASFEGARAFNLRGAVVHMDEIIAAIEAAAPEAAGRITYDDKPLPFPDRLDESGLASVLDVTHTPLNEGVAQTVALFREALADGRIQQ